jgi:transcription elongation factor GreA
MTSHQTVVPISAPSVDPVPGAPAIMLTGADFAVLELELDSLRSKHRAELAARLRDARSFGRSADNDDVLTVLEEAVIDEARIAQLEELARSALLVADDWVPPDGLAGLGSTVEVADNAGQTVEYQLVGRRSSASTPREVSLASPVGKALRGTHAGDVVHVALPGGRQRTLRVLAVRSSARPGCEAPTSQPAKAA